MNPESRTLLQVQHRGRRRGRRDLHHADGRRGRAAPRSSSRRTRSTCATSTSDGDRGTVASPPRPARRRRRRRPASRRSSRRSTSKTRCARSYLDYAMCVIVARALPDVRDGLKPVHRRILVRDARRGPARTTARYTKCAGVVGEVLKQYHPHGDAVGLRRAGAHGAGLLPALPARSTARATSARSTATRRRPCATPRRGSTRARRGAARRHRQGDGRLRARTTTSTHAGAARSCRRAFPNLLVNGSAGIAVGMATNIPPHNLGEVVDALIASVDDARAARSTS